MLIQYHTCNHVILYWTCNKINKIFRTLPHLQAIGTFFFNPNRLKLFYQSRGYEYHISSCFHCFSYLTLTHFLLLKIPSMYSHMALPPDSSDLPQHPNAVSGLSASCTHSRTHSHPSLHFIFNPVNQTLLTDDADPHAALTPSAREREGEREAGKTGTSCGKDRRWRENKELENDQR